VKFANPLYYPIPVLAGAISLVIGVRVGQLPSGVMLPIATAIATIGATVRKAQEPDTLGLEDAELEKQVQAVRQQAKTLAERADALRTEATRLLSGADQMDLLVAVQFACDRADELPAKLDQLAQRLKGSDSLLSLSQLQQQLQEVKARQENSSGITREHLTKLANSLQRNIELAQQGQDTRQAQVVSLSTLILDAAGVLQSLQNRLRTVDLTDAQATGELRSLSDEFNSFQENVDLLVSR
jgi:DNA-binding ferritin-like protein